MRSDPNSAHVVPLFDRDTNKKSFGNGNEQRNRASTSSLPFFLPGHLWDGRCRPPQRSLVISHDLVWLVELGWVPPPVRSPFDGDGGGEVVLRFFRETLPPFICPSRARV